MIFGEDWTDVFEFHEKQGLSENHPKKGHHNPSQSWAESQESFLDFAGVLILELTLALFVAVAVFCSPFLLITALGVRIITRVYLLNQIYKVITLRS